MRISLRFLLAAITFACVLLAYDQRFRRQRKAADQLGEVGAKIVYHPAPAPWLPEWLGDQLRDVQAVDLSHCRVDSAQLMLLYRCPRLKRLYLARTSTTDDHLALLTKLKKLERLALWHTDITDKGARHLALLEDLRVLDVQGTRLTEASLGSLSKLKSLRRLIFDFKKFSDVGLGYLAQVPSAQFAELHCENITDAGLRALSSVNRDNYRITRLRRSNISDEALLALAPSGGTLPIGPEFQVEGCSISDAVLSAMPWDELTDVRFIDTNVSYDGVARRIGKSIEVLTVGERGFGLARSWNWSHRGWAPIGLRVWLERDPSELTVEQISLLPNLTGIRLDRKESMGDLLAHLRGHTRLTRVHMSSAPKATPVIEQIADLKHLQHVHLNCCNPRTKFDIRALAKLKDVRKIEFYCTPFGDEGLETIGQLRELRELVLSSAHGVKGPGLRHLRNLNHLQHLEIQSRASWDASIEHVLALDHVKRIKLIDVKLSDENIARFEATRGWSHRVVWK